MPDTYDDEEIVRVGTAPNPIIAASWQELLRAEGIPSMVKIDDPLGVAYSVASFYACGIFVLGAYADQARELLDELVDEGG